jgi:hypothetical protein
MKTIAQLIKWDFEANGSLEIKNKNGKRIYFENSDGFWVKREYDFEGKEIYYENSDGYWAKQGHDSEGNLIYYENSDGQVVDNRHFSAFGFEVMKQIGRILATETVK